MMSEHVPTGTIVRRFLYLNVTCVGEPLVKSVEKPVALVRKKMAAYLFRAERQTRRRKTGYARQRLSG